MIEGPFTALLYSPKWGIFTVSTEVFINDSYVKSVSTVSLWICLASTCGSNLALWFIFVIHNAMERILEFMACYRQAYMVVKNYCLYNNIF